MEEKTFSCDKQGILGAKAFLESVYDAPRPAIVMDEIVSNIVRCSGSKDFTVGLEPADGGVTMVFSDGGRAFDPTTEAAVPDVSAAVGDRNVGGLGIFMVKKMSKSVSYRREGERNVLTVAM